MGDRNKGPYCYCLHQLGNHNNLQYFKDGVLIPSETLLNDIEAPWIGEKCNKCECEKFNITFLDERIRLIQD